MSIAFGTDGWRAVISDTFTFENVGSSLKRSADYVAEHAGTGDRAEGQAEVVVGFDTRFLSIVIHREVARVMAGNGVIIGRADAPTPAVSYAVFEKQAVAG